MVCALFGAVRGAKSASGFRLPRPGARQVPGLIAATSNRW
jgi:hypothetical protein